MPQNFFITGLPKAGKTTLLSVIIADLRSRGLHVGGFISPEEKRSGRRTGFLVQDIESGKTGVLAEMDADGPKVSKYHVDIGSFESIAMMSLSEFGRYDVIIMDEIGWMESKSDAFLDALDRVIASRTPLIASLHEDFVGRFAPFGKVYELSESNREQVCNDILGEIRSIIGKPSKAPKAAKAGKRPAKKPAKAAAKKGKWKRNAGTKAAVEERRGEKVTRKGDTKGKPHKKKKGFIGDVRDLMGF
jgi:nucleoside-triphosphatase